MTIDTTNPPMGAETVESGKLGVSSFVDHVSRESWEISDLEENMKKLLVPQNENKQEQVDLQAEKLASPENANGNVELVDQFLREALQNTRDRLTILRMELDVQKFMQNPTQQQLEFQQLPTSYLRLAAHRVAQHYGLQSMVVDWNSPDGSGTRIVARKTPESRYPAIRLADIPVSQPQDEKTSVVKFAIKPRPQKGFQANGHKNGLSINPSKSVEERKEEYNRARARIFSSNSDSGGLSVEAALDIGQCCSNGSVKPEEKPSMDEFQNNYAKGLSDCPSGTDRIHNYKEEREPVGEVKTSRIAIFRDREKDRNDPDYDRSYDRYTQCFDPGFGFNFGPFNMQPLYAPFVHYNSEFSQLGPLHRVQTHMEPTAHPVQGHVNGHWVVPPSTMGYGPPNAMMGAVSPAPFSAHSASAMHLHSSQFACPGPAMTYVHPQDPFLQPLVQSHLHQQPELCFSEGRRR
eukprot:Gb_21004 [translate_table: standard]